MTVVGISMAINGSQPGCFVQCNVTICPPSVTESAAAANGVSSAKLANAVSSELAGQRANGC